MRLLALGLFAALVLPGCSPPPDDPPSEVPGTSGGTSAATSVARPAESADPALVALAREVMGGDARQDRCGPYGLLTDVLDVPLLAASARLAQQLDEVFEQRYGVRPSGDPKETVVLFSRLEGFREFTRRHGRVALGYAGYTLASRGLAVFYRGELPRQTFLATLSHELTHLAIRRAFGDGLPPWLTEGLADGIGDSATEQGFTPLENRSGIAVQLERLRGAYDLGRASSLERLASLERGQFDRGLVSYDYEQSTLLVRYLLSDPDLAPRFQGFLRDLAGGRGYSAERFRQSLGVSWDDLEALLEAWVRAVPAA